MNEWGSAHVIIHHELLGRLTRDFQSDVEFIRSSLWDDDCILALVRSSELPEGYHGHQDIYLESFNVVEGVWGGYKVRFKKECDV